MKNVFILILVFIVALGFGQDTLQSKEAVKLIDKKSADTKSNTEHNLIFTTVQVPAIPPGGMNAFRKFIATSFRMPEVTEKTIGTVLVRFVVWDDGSINDFQIIKETPENLGLGKEAIRVISSSEKWEPGKYNGRKVKQYYTLPISIQITPADKSEKPVDKSKKDKQ